MSMYKRPLPRVRNTQRVHHPVKITEGSYLHNLINPGPTKFYKYEPDPVYQREAYLAALKKNNEELGIPFKDPKLPESIPIVRPEPKKEPELTFVDKVYVKMRILKSGIVRIKLDASIATLYEKYYRKAKRPPAKSIIQAYKSMGFGTEYLEKIKKRFDWNVKEQKRIEKVIDSIFNKEAVKKPKKKKKEEEEIVEEEKEVEEEDPPEDDEEDDTPDEDDGMDVEPEVEDDVEEPVEEEEYFSD
ncbi:hypothetical protein OtV6_018c [Ostreococcus tauri virus RT-2011]|nr:hypothetical protein OtV6_018c [Ostreococcus tauri virus RT-2011]